jgi:predicted LPLAT superfamily acyltransferase
MRFSPCVIVPVYNHTAGARALIERLATFQLPTIVVDDGSTAVCTAELRSLAAQHDWLILVEHDRNRGKGAAVVRGFREARARSYTHALQIDADGQHDTEEVPRFVALAMQNPNALIAGIPIFDNSIPRHRFVLRYLTHVWVWIETLSLDIRDSMCGFRVYPLAQTIGVANNCRLGQRMDFDTEIIVRLHWLGVPIVSTPTKVTYPEDGHSNFRMLQDNALITWMHIRLVFGMIQRAPSLVRSRRTSQTQQEKCLAEVGGRESGPDEHWALAKERGVYLGLYTVLIAYRLFGRFFFSLLLYPIIAYFLLSSGVARRASRDFLARVAATEQDHFAIGQAPGWRHVYRHFMSFGEACLDKFLAWTGAIDAEALDMVNEEVFENLRRSGKGGLLIASHLGNIEVCRAIGTHAKGLRINALVHTKHAQNFNRLMQKTCPESPVLLLQTTEIGPDTAMLLRDRIERGEFIVIAGDRVPLGGDAWTTWTNFLGKSAPFPSGPHILASLLDCPVLLLFCVRDRGRYRVIFEPFAERIDIPRKSRAKTLRHFVVRYASRLEYYSLRYPYQWYNFFGFWNQVHEPDRRTNLTSHAPQRIDAD